MTKIYGSGLMFIPSRGNCVPFDGGVIITDDNLIIEAAKANGFQVVEEQPELIEQPEVQAPKVTRRRKDAD